MLRILKTVTCDLVEIPSIDAVDKGCWVNLVAPTEQELEQVTTKLGIIEDFLKYPLDEEERSRIEVEDGQVLIIINVPVVRMGDNALLYDTIPLGIIITAANVLTVCLEPTELIEEISSKSCKSIFTFKKTRFLLQILFKTASVYLKYLRQIDRKTNEIERQLHQSMKNEELIKLLGLEKSLVYFITSLKSNEIVMEKLLRSQLLNTVSQEQEGYSLLRLYPEDKELLEDVITENKQAIEMAETHSDILSGMMDAFASVISNNLNIVMKFLTSMTIVLSIPTMLASFGGMNFALPFQNSPYAFWYVLGASITIGATATVALYRKRMF
jgi:magnesium transporter